MKYLKIKFLTPWRTVPEIFEQIFFDGLPVRTISAAASWSVLAGRSIRKKGAIKFLGGVVFQNRCPKTYIMEEV